MAAKEKNTPADQKSADMLEPDSRLFVDSRGNFAAKAGGIRVIAIDTIEDAEKHLFFHQEYQESIGRNRHLYAFRGIPDAGFSLITSLQRVCKSQKTALEKAVLDNFAKYAELESPTVTQSVWRKMILGQHHGLPTRLLDWSLSPLMALHFAMTESNMDLMDQRDCALWRLDIEKLNGMLPQKYRDRIDRARQNVFTVDMLQDVCQDLATYDADMGAGSMVMMEPPTIDMRIANQYSFFSVVPDQVRKVEDILEKCPDGVVKYVINRNIRWEIRDMLDQANINERIVYPGLDGIATWLGRYYYVRDLTRFEIRTMSIADLSADVIVNPSNTDLKPYAGVNQDIFRKAGESRLRAECEKAKALAKIGEVVPTPAGKLQAKKIYHVVAKPWDPEKAEESRCFLSELYRRVLDRVRSEGYHSVGFPLLSAGANGCPEETAWRVAIRACQDFQQENPGYQLTVTICVIETAVQKLGEAVRESIVGNTALDDEDPGSDKCYRRNL